MQQTNNFIVLNIREYLENDDGRLGEEKLLQFLSEFSCPLNKDVERFLKHQAVEFAKKHQAVTYLVLSLEDAELLGYFSITIKPLVVKAEPFSNTVKRKLARFSEIDKGGDHMRSGNEGKPKQNNRFRGVKPGLSNHIRTFSVQRQMG